VVLLSSPPEKRQKPKRTVTADCTLTGLWLSLSALTLVTDSVSDTDTAHTAHTGLRLVLIRDSSDRVVGG